MAGKDVINSLIAYPRSGSNWLLYRIHLFFNEVLRENCRDRGETTAKLAQSGQIWRKFGARHLGYRPNWQFLEKPIVVGTAEKRFRNLVRGENELYLLLRHPLDVLNSHYHFLRRGTITLTQGQKRKVRSPYEFAMGKYGISRLCSFANELSRFLESTSEEERQRTHFLFYEDAFSPEFLDIIPQILHLPSSIMSSRARQEIFQQSEISYLKRAAKQGTLSGEHPNNVLYGVRYREGIIGSYREVFGEDEARVLLSYLRDNCDLDFYLDRYVRPNA